DRADAGLEELGVPGRFRAGWGRSLGPIGLIADGGHRARQDRANRENSHDRHIRQFLIDSIKPASPEKGCLGHQAWEVSPSRSHRLAARLFVQSHTIGITVTIVASFSSFSGLRRGWLSVKIPTTHSNRIIVASFSRFSPCPRDRSGAGS